MKKILFLLLLTVSVYGQNPTPFNKIKITSNTTSSTATKVNVQEANGEINTVAKSDLTDILSYSTASALPVTGVAGKLYYTADDKKYYTWDGTIYNEFGVGGGGASVSDTAYNATSWNGVTTIAPSKNAIRDKIESLPNGTVTSVDIGLDQIGDDISFSVSNQNIEPLIGLSIPTASATKRGALSSTDWSTFNGKQDALGFTPYNATNPSGYQTLAQVNAKISDELWELGAEGLTNIASSQNAVFNGIANVYSYAESIDNNKQPLAAVLSNTTASFTTAQETKLSGIATGATANSSDATLLARANHTGTQTASTISDFNSASDARVAIGVSGKQDALVSGTNIKTVNSTSLLGSGNVAVEPTITAGTTGQYWRGDKTWQTLPAGGGDMVNANTEVITGFKTIKGNTGTDGAQFLTERAGVTGSGTNWALASGATNLNVGGYTHTTGSTANFVTALAAVSGTSYRIIVTISGRTAGTVNTTFGAVSTGALSATSTFYLTTTSTAFLTLIPTTDFDGTVVVSVRDVTAGSSTMAFQNSTGNVVLEINTTRDVAANGSGGNTIIGLNTSKKILTVTSLSSGINNTTVGEQAGQEIIGASNNTLNGFRAGKLIISSNNTVTGSAAFSNAVSGNSNVIVGYNSANSISNSSSLTSLSQSVVIGSDTRVLNNGDTNEIVIGYGVVGAGSNTATLGNASITTTRLRGAVQGGSFVKDSGVATQFLMADGTTTNVSDRTGQIIVTSGTSFTTPSTGVTTSTIYNIELVGAGGGGGGGVSSGSGSGGGAGGYVFKRLTGLNPNTTYTCAIGTGGSSASNGTSTTLTIGATTYTASGGNAGTTSASSAGGTGGTGTNGDLNITGGAGDSIGTASNALLGARGGSSAKGWGNGGTGTSLSSAGVDGTGYGGGGGAGRGTSTNGGAGTAGIIFCQWYN